MCNSNKFLLVEPPPYNETETSDETINCENSDSGSNDSDISLPEYDENDDEAYIYIDEIRDYKESKKNFIDLIGIIVFFAVNVMLFFVLIKPYFINSCINETNYRNTTCIQYICSNKRKCRFIDTCDYCDSFMHIFMILFTLNFIPSVIISSLFIRLMYHITSIK